MKSLIYLVFVASLTGCASAPISKKECVKINQKTYCDTVEPKEPREVKPEKH
jgi:hypothetical protein